jgi:hypothetical protein
VTIYESQESPSGSTTFPTVLANLVNPLGPGVGPISLAAGDFTGSGETELAMAPESLLAGMAPSVSIFAFSESKSATPSSARALAPTLMAKLEPDGLAQATGLTLAAADFSGTGADQLAIAPVGGATAIDVYADSPGGVWNMENQLNLTRLEMNGGASVAAGPLESGDRAVLAVGSMTRDVVKIIDPLTGAVIKKLHPFGQSKVGVRIALVTPDNGFGVLVVTPRKSGSSAPKPVLYSERNWAHHLFAPCKSPGRGAFVPLGGGYVRHRATIAGRRSAASHRPGPMRPTVLFASMFGSRLVFQGATPSLSPFPADTIVEPILSR